MFKQKRGQSTLEYALLIAVAVLAFLAIAPYLQKAIQGRLKSSSDMVSQEQFDGTEITIAPYIETLKNGTIVKHKAESSKDW